MANSPDSACATARAIIQDARQEAAARPIVHAFFDTATCTVSYVVRDPASNRCAILDSVLDFDAASGGTSTAAAQELVGCVESEGLEVQWLLETHAHADHLSAAPYLQAQLGGRLAIGREIRRVQQDFGKIFNEGSQFARDGRDGNGDKGRRCRRASCERPAALPADHARHDGDAHRADRPDRQACTAAACEMSLGFTT